MKKALLLGWGLLSFCGWAQSYPMEGDLILIEGDSIPNASVQLDEVILFPPLEFASYDTAKDYAVLRARTIRVYPYAKLAADRFEVLNRKAIHFEEKTTNEKNT